MLPVWAAAIAKILTNACSTAQYLSVESFMAAPKLLKAFNVIGLRTKYSNSPISS
jgi:hypothetical protein